MGKTVRAGARIRRLMRCHRWPARKVHSSVREQSSAGHAGLVATVACLLSACTHVTVGEGGGETITGIGVVRVELPRTTGGAVAVKRTGVGFGWDELPAGGAWLGYSDSQWVIADPRDCQLLVIIRSAAEAENAAKALSALEGSSPCVVDHTNTLQP